MLVNCHLTQLELTGLLPAQVETVLGLVGPDTRLTSISCSVTRLPCRLDRVDPHLLATAVNRTLQVGYLWFVILNIFVCCVEARLVECHLTGDQINTILAAAGRSTRLRSAAPRGSVITN